MKSLQLSYSVAKRIIHSEDPYSDSVRIPKNTRIQTILQQLIDSQVFTTIFILLIAKSRQIVRILKFWIQTQS